MIHRWIHRRALLAWLLLPWLALLLVMPGLVLIDLGLGDGVSRQDLALRPTREWLWQAAMDLPLALAGLYAAGSVVWLLGVLMGSRSARRSALVLGVLCAAGSVMLGRLVGMAWYQPAPLLLGGVAFLVGGLYAALTHRPTPRVLRRLSRPLPPAPPPPPPPPPPPSPPPVPTLMRHEPPTTLPVEY